MRILTGNDLKTGAVVWWTGATGRSMSKTPSMSAKKPSIARREESARRVNVPYVIDADLDEMAAPPRPYQGPRPRARPDRAPRPHSQTRRSRYRQLGDLMYRYDTYDQAMVEGRVAEFRDQCRAASTAS